MSSSGGSSVFGAINLGKGKSREFVVPLDMDKKKTIRTGRGGAGNYASETGPDGPAEPKRFRVPAGREVAVRTRRPTGQKSLTTGRGGSGNSKRVTGKDTEGEGVLNLDPHEVAVLKFNQAESKGRTIKSGRGGVGNITTSPENSTYARTIGTGIQSTSSGSSSTSPRLFGSRKTSLTQSSSFVLTPLESINSRSTSISRAYTVNNDQRSATPMSVQTSTDVTFANPRASLYGLSQTGPQSPAVPKTPTEHIQMKTFSAARRHGAEGTQGLPDFPEPFSFPEPKTPRTVASPTSSSGGVTQWHMPNLSRKTTIHRPGTSNSTVTDWSVASGSTDATMTKEQRDILSVRRGLKMAQVFGEDRYYPDLTDYSQPLSHSRSADVLRQGGGYQNHSPNSSQSALGHYPSSSTSSGNPWNNDTLRSDTTEIRGSRTTPDSLNTHDDEEYSLSTPVSSPPPDVKSRRRASIVMFGGGLPSPVMPVGGGTQAVPVKEKKNKLAGAITRMFRKGPVVQLQQPDWGEFTEEETADVLSRLRNL